MAEAVDALELTRLIPELRGKSVAVSPLPGGLTNRNYRVDAGDENFILRIPGQNTQLLGIDRNVEIACARSAAQMGLGPEVIAYLPEHGAILTRLICGRTLESENLKDPAMLGSVATALRRYHDGPCRAGSFSPFATVRQYRALASERHVQFPDTLPPALELLARLEEELLSRDTVCPCHNDLLAGNFIQHGDSVFILDWEYGGIGDRFFDLGNLAVNNGLEPEHERVLLSAYFGEVKREHWRRLRLMRLASDMREAMWGFLQSAISTLEIDYVAYGRKHLERFLASARREGFE